MATAGSIVVDLLMRTGSFETDARRAERRARELARSIDQAFLGVAAAGAAAATGLGYLVKGAIDSADEISKAAKSVGLTTESLSAFLYAADLSGVSAEELSSAIAKLDKNAVAAAEGAKAPAAAFEQLGVSLVDAHGAMRDTEAVMLDVMEAFAGLEEGPQKTAMAMEIFGKSGAKLIPLLNSGKEGMAAMTAEAERLGLVIGTETAEAAERFNDNITRLNKVFEGFVNHIMTGALPALEEFAEELQNPRTAEAAQALAAAIVSSFNSIVAAIRETVNFARWLGESFAAITEGIAGDDIVRLEDRAAELRGKLAKPMAGEFSLYEKGEWFTIKDRQDLQGELDKITGQIGTYYRDYKPPKIDLPPEPGASGGKRTLALRTEEETPGGGEGGRRGGRRGGGGSQAGQNQLLSDAKVIYDATRTAAEKYAAEIAHLNELRAAGVIDQETYNRSVANAQAGMDAARDALYQGLLTEEEELTQSYERRKEEILAATEITELERQDLLARLQADFSERMNDISGEGYWERWLEGAREAMQTLNDITASALDQFSSGFGQAFESIIFDSQSLGDAFTQLAETMARGIVNALGQMAAQWLAYQAVQMLVGKTTAATAATAKIAEAAMSQQMAAINAYASTAAIPVVGPVAAPGAAAAALAATAPFVAAITGLAGAAVGARADGGPVTGGMPYLIGERGPELFVPNTNGAVVPNGKFGGNAISINLIEDKRKAGTTEQRNTNGEDQLDIFVADIMTDGPRSKAIQRAYGLQRRGY